MAEHLGRLVLSLGTEHKAHSHCDQLLRASGVPARVQWNPETGRWEVYTDALHFSKAAHLYLVWYEWMVAHARPLSPEETESASALRTSM